MGKKRKSNNSTSDGCVMPLVYLLAFGVIVTLVYYVLNFILGVFRSFWRGVVICVPWIIMMALLVIALGCIFYFTHRKPLTYTQIKKLAKRNSNAYARKMYAFKKDPVTVNPIFKSNMNASGKWYEIEEPVDSFPTYVAALLEGKHHEWMIIAIEKDGLVCNMWVNKGSDNKSVSLNCDLNDVVRKCKTVGGYTILRFHNHPNSDPKHFTTLLASDQDKASAVSCSEFVDKEGINWLDFVCSRGEFLQFYSHISDSFEYRGGGISDIIDIIGITPQMDYELQKKYYNMNRFDGVVNHKYVIASILVVIAIGITIVGYSDLLSSKTDSKEAVNETLVDVSTETVDVSEEWRIASLDDFEYEYENDGITLGEYNGNSSCVIIPSSYEVEGTNLPVLALDDTFRGNENIINVIVSEGVTTISTGTFDNCSGLKHLYIPSTLSSIGYSLEKFESGEILYYGGTESEWLLIKQVSRSQIAFKKIVYNATEDDCKNNKDTYIEESVSDSSGIFSPLSNFAYDVQDGSLVLEDYCGDENCIVVASCYSVDGVECPVIELDNTFIHCRAETIIISEGVQTLSTALFNGCDATIIYLPSSVQDVSLSFWNYFHDLDTIYYGGTEEQFSALLDKKNRWDLDVKHIIYEATVEDVLNEIELDD